MNRKREVPLQIFGDIPFQFKFYFETGEHTVDPRLAKYCELEQLIQELEDAFKKADSFGTFLTVSLINFDCH
jgi:hypothetical protein